MRFMPRAESSFCSSGTPGVFPIRDFQPGGVKPCRAVGNCTGGEGVHALDAMVPFETPRALELGEIPAIVEAYREGARGALAAGFDGVELHGANGYLIEQFLHSKTNQRTDIYGGSVENRSRLLIEVMTALVEIWGGDRIGVRLSPFGVVVDAGEPDPIGLQQSRSEPTCSARPRLRPPDQILQHRCRGGRRAAGDQRSRVRFGPAPRFPPAASLVRRPMQRIRARQGDAVAFGRHFIANPDGPRRPAARRRAQSL